jgi:hypothetical protein
MQGNSLALRCYATYYYMGLDALPNWRLRCRPSQGERALPATSATESVVIVPSIAWLATVFERHYILFNKVFNPLIDLGVLFELLLCYFFFYTPLADVCYFALVSWQVYLFACHGTVILFTFEEVKKYYRRKGFPLKFLG